jgi:hypothetical protein
MAEHVAIRPSHCGALDAVAGDELMRLRRSIECHVSLPTCVKKRSTLDPVTGSGIQ